MPLNALFSRVGNTEDFLRHLAEYVRGLLGARAVMIHREIGETAHPVSYADGGLKGATRLNSLFSEPVSTAFQSRNSHRGAVNIDNQQHAVLVVPFYLKDTEPLAISALLPPAKIAFTDPCFTILHITTQFLVQKDLFTDASENAGAFQQATLLVEMFSRTNESPTFKGSVYTLATEMEKFFGCDRVAIGTGSKRGCKVKAVSGMSDEEGRNLGLSQLGGALRESMSVGQLMVWPGQKGAPDDIVVSANHDDLLHSFKAGRILVAPFFDPDEKPIGAMAIIWKKDAAPLERISYNLVKACVPHVSSLVELLQRSKPGAVRGAFGKFFGGTVMKRVAMLAAFGLVVAAMFFPIPYRVSADCQIQAVMRRTVAAPFENRLHRAYVKPGEVVKKDQVLAELDGREIRVALAEAIASRSAAVKKRDDAMVSGKTSEFQMAQFEADRLALEVKRLQFQSDNLLIRSPISGVVLAGNLERSEGVPVTTGQKLFEIAPLDEMLVEVSIPEAEIRHIEEKMDLKMRLESRAGYKWESVIEKIHPVSEISQSENVFVADAFLQNRDEELRPGMRGTARVISKPKPIGWILFHRVWEYLRLKVW